MSAMPLGARNGSTACAWTANGSMSREENAVGCAAEPRVMHLYRVGARVTGNVYIEAGAACIAQSLGLHEFYVRGAEVPSTEFVEMTQVP